MPASSTGKNNKNVGSEKPLTQLFTKVERLVWVQADCPRSLAGFVFPLWATAAFTGSAEGTPQFGHIKGLHSTGNHFRVYLGFRHGSDARAWVTTISDPFSAQVTIVDPSKDSRWKPNPPSTSDVRSPQAVVTISAKSDTPEAAVSGLLLELTSRQARVFRRAGTGSTWVLAPDLAAARLLRDALRLWVKTSLDGFNVDILDISGPFSQSTTIKVHLQRRGQVAQAGFSIHDSFRALNRSAFKNEFKMTVTMPEQDAQNTKTTLLEFNLFGAALNYLAAWQGTTFRGFDVISTFDPKPPLSRKRKAEDAVKRADHKKPRLDKPVPETIDLVSSDEDSCQEGNVSKRREVIDLSCDDVVELPSQASSRDPSHIPNSSVHPPAAGVGQKSAHSLKEGSSSREGSRTGDLGEAMDVDQEDVVVDMSNASTLPLGPSSKPNTPVLPATLPVPSAATKPLGKRRSALPVKPVEKVTIDRSAKQKQSTKDSGIKKESDDHGPIADRPINTSSLPRLPKPDPKRVAKLRTDIPVRISGWFHDQRCQEPPKENVDRTIQLLSDTGEFLEAFDDLKEGRVSSPIGLIHALSKDYNPTYLDIAADDAAIYIAPTSAFKSRLAELAKSISGVQGERRREIQEMILEIAEELTKAGHSEDYVVRLLYAGTSCLLSNRGNFDKISFAYDGGTGKKDRRSPHMQTATVGGGAKHKSDTAIVYWKRGEPWIRGHQRSIQPDGPGGDIKFPVLTRIAIIGIKGTDKALRRTLESIVIGFCAPRHLNVQLGSYPRRLVDGNLVANLRAEVDPEADHNLIFLSDASGRTNISFSTSRAGDLFHSLFEDLAQRPVIIHVEDFHNNPGHDSNVRTITESEVSSMVRRLKLRPDQRVIVCMGSTVAWVFILRHLCNNPADKPNENHPFFLPVLTTILGIRCILVGMPHPGVINYIGDLNWVVDAYCNNISMLLMIGTQSARFKKSLAEKGLPLPANAADQILKSCEGIELYKEIHKELQWPGMRFLWDGPTAVVVGRHRDAGCPWEELCWAVADELKPQVIWDFTYPPANEEDAERNLMCIPAANDKGGGGDVVRSVAVPNMKIPGQYSRAQIHLPKQVRPDNPFFGYFRLDPISLALQMISPSGEFLRTTGENIMSINRGHWAVTQGYTPAALEAHAVKAGFWRPPSTWDKREMDFRKSKKNEKGKRTKLNLVHTLDESEIEKAIRRGDSVLHPFQKSYHFELWDEEKGTFVPVNEKEPWVIKAFKNRPAGVERVAPFVEKGTGLFGLRLYECSIDTGYEFKFLDRTPLFLAFDGGKVTFMARHAGGSSLAQEAKNAP